MAGDPFYLSANSTTLMPAGQVFASIATAGRSVARPMTSGPSSWPRSREMVVSLTTRPGVA